MLHVSQPVRTSDRHQMTALEMRACDELYHLSEPGSDYEYYALTCGGRVDARAVSTCVLLG